MKWKEYMTTKILFFFIASFLSNFPLFAQSDLPKKIEVDSLYREDQFYFSVTYNSLKNKIDNYKDSKFSSGVSVGFLRDMPINKARTIAFATGFGLSYNKYNQNIKIEENNKLTNYSLISGEYEKNKFSQLLLDFPIEFRFRTSTPQSTKFWRLHTGVKTSFLLNNRSVFVDAQNKIVVKNNKDFQSILFGLYAAVGYNFITVYGHYGVTNLMKKGKIDDQNIDFRSVNVGLIFYLL